MKANHICNPTQLLSVFPTQGRSRFLQEREVKFPHPFELWLAMASQPAVSTPFNANSAPESSRVESELMEQLRRPQQSFHYITARRARPAILYPARSRSFFVRRRIKGKQPLARRKDVLSRLTDRLDLRVATHEGGLTKLTFPLSFIQSGCGATQPDAFKEQKSAKSRKLSSNAQQNAFAAMDAISYTKHIGRMATKYTWMCKCMGKELCESRARGRDQSRDHTLLALKSTQLSTICS